MTKPIIEKTKLVSHRNLTGMTMPARLRTTHGKNGVPPLHAVGHASPIRPKKVIADAIMARALSKNISGVEQVLRNGINADVDSLAIQHEINQAGLDE
jgi:hypothetical protein